MPFILNSPREDYPECIQDSRLVTVEALVTVALEVIETGRRPTQDGQDS